MMNSLECPALAVAIDHRSLRIIPHARAALWCAPGDAWAQWRAILLCGTHGVAHPSNFSASRTRRGQARSARANRRSGAAAGSPTDRARSIEVDR